jgi:hypothetical protein
MWQPEGKWSCSCSLRGPVGHGVTGGKGCTPRTLMTCAQVAAARLGGGCPLHLAGNMAHSGIWVALRLPPLRGKDDSVTRLRPLVSPRHGPGPCPGPHWQACPVTLTVTVLDFGRVMCLNGPASDLPAESGSRPPSGPFRPHDTPAGPRALTAILTQLATTRSAARADCAWDPDAATLWQ